MTAAKKLFSFFTMLLLLAGCAVPPPFGRPGDGRGRDDSGVAPSPRVKTLPSQQSPDGKFYLDDGPPTAEERRAAAAATDAVVKWEPLRRANSRAYTALGKRYQPYTKLPAGYKKRGAASWYGRRYHGRQTSSGELYDMFQMTAAHPLLPIPSYARVTRADTGASVIVRINDRGPFLAGRIIDLSYAAAERLDFVRAGTAEVEVELLVPADAPPSAVGGAGAAGAANTQGAANISSSKKGTYIQLAAFEQRPAARKFFVSARQTFPPAIADKTDIYEAGDGWFRVQVGPYPTRPAAAADDKILCEQYRQCGFLTHR